MTRIGDVGLFIGMILIFGTQVVLNMTQYLGRFIQGSTSLHDYNNSDINFYRGDGKIRSVPASYVVARCNGRANARFGTYSRGDDGRTGVYLVATMFPLFSASTVAMQTVAIVGAFTAIFAASIGLVQTDIKRVLAYSTVSQLGYMMLALGSAGYVAGIFHLTTHAF